MNKPIFSLLTHLKKLLVPPGDGVFTVQTAANIKLELVKKLYGDDCSQEQKLLRWEKTLEKIVDQNHFLIGICSDNGGGILRGANWGPLFIRQELLKGKLYKEFLDLGDVKVVPHLLHDKYLNIETIEKVALALYHEKSDYPVSPLSITERVLAELYQYKPQAKVFALGGDHSVSYSLVKSYLEKSRLQNKKVALIHFDAHTDLLDTRLGIDLCFGSWTSHILPYLPDPSHCLQIGIRSSAKSKDHWEKTKGVKQIWADEIKLNGLNVISSQILKFLSTLNLDEIYISFDIDALDSSQASATGTPESGGLELHEALYFIDELCKNYTLGSSDLVEVAPFISHQEKISLEPEATLQASQLIAERLMHHLKNPVRV
jgi:agmatinase